MLKQFTFFVFFGLMIGTVIGVPQVQENLSKTTEFISSNHTHRVDLVTQQSLDEKKCTIPRGTGRRDNCSSEAFTQSISLSMRTDALAG
jgi:hypothetical protein